MPARAFPSPRHGVRMSGSPEAPADAPHVLLLIANDVTVDTRVLKYAASLSGFGLRVTVLGIAQEGPTTESEVAGAARAYGWGSR